MPAMSALTSFTDGNVVHQADLNNYGTNIDTLCQQTTGKTAAAAKSSKAITQVERNANLSIADGGASPIIITWNTASQQITDTLWTAGSPTVLTVVTAGWYQMNLQVTWASAVLSIRTSGIMVNGTVQATNSIASTSFSSTSTNVSYQQVGAYYRLAAGATIYGFVYQSSGGAVNLNPTSVLAPGTYLAVRWDAPY